MNCRRRPEDRVPERAVSRRRGRACSALLISALALLHTAPVRSQDKVLVQGLFDAEVWKTDSGSRLLSKNDGDAAPAGRLRLWAVGEFSHGLQGFVVARGEDGSGSYEGVRQGRIEQAALRYTFRAPLRLVLEAGKIVSPLGNFPRRRLSTTNPLIGAPDSYDVSYPLGVQVGGQVSRIDYRVALIDLPLINEKYVPEPGSVLRPALSLGVTPVTGLRLGGYATRGPYLSSDVDPFIPAGAGWRDFQQRVLGADIQFSRGYFELNGDFARSAYDVPAQARAVRGKSYFIEPKYTWSPRFFTALRFERNDYAYVKPLGPGVWLAKAVDFFDVEAGAGYRLGAGTVLKVAYRRDRWNVDPSLKSFFPNGYSVAAQVSYSFNVNSWIERPR